jgi:2-octaprenylphenol hydroxylase
MKTTQFDICLVGGGMVGASLALLLAQQHKDWRIALVEGFPLSEPTEALYQPSFDARSSALSLGTIEVFQHLGLWDHLSLHHTPIHRVHVSDKGHFGGVEITRQQHGVDMLGAVVENAWLGQVLLQQLHRQPNIELIAPATVSQLQAKRNGMQFAVNHDDRNSSDNYHCELMVLADGGESPLAQSLGINYHIKNYQQDAIIANVEYSEPHLGTAYERFTSDGPMALLPLGESTNSRTAALVWTQPKDKTQAAMALSDDDFLANLQQRFGFRQGLFCKVSPRFSYPLQLKIAQEQIRSSLVLMGNSAPFLHPVAGQGFNLALRDCAALCEVLNEAAIQKNTQQATAQTTASHNLGDLRTLEKYRQQQQLDQQLTVGFSDTIVTLFSSHRNSLEVARNLGFLGLDLIPQAKQFLAKQTMGLASRKHRILGHLNDSL